MTTATQTDIKTETLRLATSAFEAFCVDIEGMFGTEVKCRELEQQGGNIESLQKHFKKLCAINRVTAQGILDGNFYLLLGQEGLFTLGGIFVMLPEKTILENRKFGTAQQAQAMGDAIKEAGNLLVGSWDRIFRENMSDHKHFLQTGTFISNTWQDTEKHIGLAKDAALNACFYELTAGGFPAFECCVAFPDSIFIPKPQADTVESATQEKAQAEEPVAVEKEVVEKPAEPVAVKEAVQNNAAESSQKQPQQPAAAGSANSEKVKIFQILDLKALDIMNSDIKWCDPGCTVEKAMEQMQQTKTDYLLVGGEQKAQGIVAMSDLSAAISIYLNPMFSKWKRELDEATLRIKVQAIMSKPVRCILPDTPLDVVAEKIVRLGGCLVVMDINGKTLGIITSKDFITRLLR